MNKKLVMWGTFVVMFFVGMIGSYKFVNRNSQDMTIELSAPTLPLVSVVIGEESFNALHGYTSEMDVCDTARYIYPVEEDRRFYGQIKTFGAEVKEIRYEVRNNDGSRLIESGTADWKETQTDVLTFQVKMKDLISVGEEYIFTAILSTENHKEIYYHTRIIYGNTYDIHNQLAFVKAFHENTFDKEKTTEIAPYLEPDRNRDNSSLAHVDIHSAAKQIVWGDLPVKRLTEPQVFVTYLQDNYGAYTLEYYVSGTVNDTEEYYHVTEDFLVSTYGEVMYLLDYQRTVNSMFQYETDVYQNDKINLSIQNNEIPMMESEDGNMAAFVVNSTLYYYDDNSNEMNYVYGFMDGINNDERSAYFHHNIKALQVSEDGSIYFVVYGYMNRGSHEGKVGAALYSYHGQTKLIEEIGFFESHKSAEYVMQELDDLAYMSRQGRFYFCADGNIVVHDIKAGSTKVLIAHKPEQALYVSDDRSCVVVENGREVSLWQLETGVVREIKAAHGGVIVPQGFIANDFVYGIAKEKDIVLQSDGTYAYYMSEVCIQDAQGEIQKQYKADNMVVTSCTILDNQILLERGYLNHGTISPASQDQIVARKNSNDDYNTLESALTATCQTIIQVDLKNKINVETLEHRKAKEVFFEGSRTIKVDTDSVKAYCTAHSPWCVTEYVENAGTAMKKADALEGYARDEKGIVIWKKAATVTKNQIMAIELETETAQRSSKIICMDIMLRQIGSPKDTQEELGKGKTCQQILANISEDFVFMDVSGCSLPGILYYINQDIPVMVLHDSGEALLITGFNPFNVVVMDPVSGKLGYMARSDASEMLEKVDNQVFTYYRRLIN